MSIVPEESRTETMTAEMLTAENAADATDTYTLSEECEATTLPPFRLFTMTLVRSETLTPSLRRFTFHSDDLAELGDPGFDQRLKMILPAPISAPGEEPRYPRTKWQWATPFMEAEDWLGVMRSMDNNVQPTIRTYTARAVRYEVNEIDVDMGVHRPYGPAGTWLSHAQPGDEIVMFARNRAFVGDCGGQDFLMPEVTDAVLLGGDETAAPAIARILECLPRDTKGVAVVEVPYEADLAYFPSHPGIDLRVIGREGAQRSERFIVEMKKAAAELAPIGEPHEVEDIDVDSETLWEVPRHRRGGAALKRASLYTWLAGEAGAIKTLRRHLVSERGMDRRAVAFMGYWREGISKG